MQHDETPRATPHERMTYGRVQRRLDDAAHCAGLAKPDPRMTATRVLRAFILSEQAAGLSDAEFRHLVTMMFVTAPEQWSKGEPVCPYSQRTLARLEGAQSVQTIRRRQRRLEELALCIAHFDEDNHPDRAHRIDLRPMLGQYATWDDAASVLIGKARDRRAERRRAATARRIAVSATQIVGEPLQQRPGQNTYTSPPPISKTSTGLGKGSVVPAPRRDLKRGAGCTAAPSLTKTPQPPNDDGLALVLLALMPHHQTGAPTIDRSLSYVRTAIEAEVNRLGIPRHVWETGVNRLGWPTAAAVVALATQGHVRNPVGFARNALVYQEVEEMNYWASAYAVAKARAKEPPARPPAGH